MVEITLLDIISRVVCGVDGREDPVDIFFDIIIGLNFYVFLNMISKS